MGTQDGGDDRYRLQVIERTLAVLFAFSTARPVLTLDELVGALAINKTSLFRIVRTLEIEGLLIRDDESYRLGPRVLELGNVYLSTLSVHHVAQRHLAELAAACGQTVSMAILDGLDVVYVAIEHAQREVGIQGEIGGRHPAHATGLGKVLLAELSDDEILERIGDRPLKRLTHRTVVEPQALLRRLRQVRDDGYAIDDEERGIGIRCVAAPVRDRQDRVIAAVSVAGPIFHLTDEIIDDVRRSLLATAAAISVELGHVEREMSVA